MEKNILEKYKGKVIALEFKFTPLEFGGCKEAPFQSCHYVRLINISDNLLEIQSWNGHRMFVPSSNILITYIDVEDEDSEKFSQWEKKIKLNPDFVPQELLDHEKKNRGFTIFKKRN